MLGLRSIIETNINTDVLTINQFITFTNMFSSYFNSTKIGQLQRNFLMKHFDDPILRELIKYKYYFGYGALFLVHKEKILKRPLLFWEKLYEGFNTITPSAGWGLEKMWNLILNDYYEKIEWLISQHTMNTRPLDELINKYIKFPNKNRTLFITKKITNKYLIYKNKLKNLFLISKEINVSQKHFNNYKKSYVYSINNFYKINVKNKCLDVVYFGDLSKLELENCIELLIKLYSRFYFIIDNCIKYDGFYLNNTQFDYIFNKLKFDNNINILGTYDKLMFCQYKYKNE